MITDATQSNDPIVFVNGAFSKITGYSSDEVLGRNPRFLQAGDDDQPALDDLRAARKSNNDDIEWRGVLRNYRKDGSLFYNELVVTAVRDEEGRTTHHIGFVTDVTERLEAQGRLRFQAHLLDAAGQAIVAIDLSGRILYWNRAAEELYGWAVEEAVGRLAHEVMVSEEQMELAGEIWAELVAGRSWSGEFVVRRRDGTTFPALVTDTPVFDERGSLVGIIGVSTDLTERARAEEALRKSERRFRQLFENSADALFVMHPETREVADCNREACRSLGYSREELLGLRLEDLADEVLSEEEKARRGNNTPWRRALAGESGTIIGFHENVHRRKDGTTFPVEVGVGSIDYAGRRMIFASCRDATERKRAEEALRLRDRAIAESKDGVVITGPNEQDQLIVYVNRGFERMSGYAAEELLGRNCRMLQRPETDQTALRGLRAALREGREWSGILRNYKKDGTPFWNELSVSPVRDEGGSVTHFVGVMNDVTGRKELEKRLEYQAFHDPLTGLPNRQLFLDRLEQALRRLGRRGGSEKVAVLFMDLDNFKTVNDSLGHEVGDELLVAAGKRIRGCLRPEDTLSRFGGDEFTALIDNVGDRADAVRVAERIMDAHREPFDLGGQEFFVKPSIGIALGDACTTSSEDLLRDADTAMYRAKGEGLRGYRVFEPVMYEQALRRMKLENDLRRAIERDQIRVLYQPVFSLKLDRVVAMEALLRWEHPNLGTILPAEFIPLAEETGLIVPMGRWVLEEACRQAREWQERLPSDPPLLMGVNLSLRQFQDPGLAGDVARILWETGLDPSNLALEITESVAMHDVDSTVATLEKLKSLGVWLVIDDFGTGNGSLFYLTSRFKMDHLKIDGSFVREFIEDPDNSAIIPGLIDFAHAVGLRVIAEGVETSDQLWRLKEMGCELVQGNHIAKPLEPAAASELLADKISPPAEERKR